MRNLRDSRVLLFVALVLVAPAPVAVLWGNGTWGLPARLLTATGVGFLVWCAVILLKRVYAYPELLFILLVNVAPIPVALLWSHGPWGFLGRWLACMGAGNGIRGFGRKRKNRT